MTNPDRGGADLAEELRVRDVGGVVLQAQRRAGVEVDLAVSQAEEDRGGVGEVPDRPGLLVGGGAPGGVAQEDRAGVVDAARPAGIAQWLRDA